MASRRASEALIEQGRVSINGKKASLGDKADPARDIIRVDGEVVHFDAAPLVYIMLNKPAGVVSAVSAQRQEKRKTVLDLVPVAERVYPVGRLDADSEGLILLTNDGELTQRLTHPRYGHQKTYRVLVEGVPTPRQIADWAKGGIMLDDGPTAPCTVKAEKEVEVGTWLEITMGEGRKRQIRRTAARLGLRVLRLIRTHIGPLRLSGIAPGEWRYLTEEEVTALKRAVNRPARARRPRRTPPTTPRRKPTTDAQPQRRKPPSGGRQTQRTQRPSRRSGGKKRQ